jgi:DNA-binding NarL/FixJ family response regulator
MTYKEKIINHETGNITWRDYTPEEIAEVEANIIEAKKRADEEAEKLAKRQSALSKLIDLGLTEEEIAAL